MALVFLGSANGALDRRRLKRIGLQAIRSSHAETKTALQSPCAILAPRFVPAAQGRAVLAAALLGDTGKLDDRTSPKICKTVYPGSIPGVASTRIRSASNRA
jgi:hypothetical protein